MLDQFVFRFQYVSSQELLEESENKQRSVFAQNIRNLSKKSASSGLFGIITDANGNEMRQENCMYMDYENFKDDWANKTCHRKNKHFEREQEVLPCMAVSPTPRRSQRKYHLWADNVVAEHSNSVPNYSKQHRKFRVTRNRFRFVAITAILSLVLNLFLMVFIGMQLNLGCFDDPVLVFNNFVHNLNSRFVDKYFLSSSDSLQLQCLN